MIPDYLTNYLYLADTLPKKYPNFYARFEKALCVCDIKFSLMPDTKDVWAVDYMPIQLNTNRFVRFLYRPPYLTKYKKYNDKITDTDAICLKIGINTINTNIILDGGNIVRSAKKVIMTDRVFVDNPNIERRQLIKELYELLEAENIYFVPVQPGDFTGHADGMLRFIDDDRIVINDYKKEKEWFYRAFEIAVHNTGLEAIKIPYNVYENKNDSQANGDYINYLQMENVLFLPVFGLKEDDIALKQFEQLFPGQKIAIIESNEIANEGGVLNCISWNIRKEN
jgi:agmatine deiminase